MVLEQGKPFAEAANEVIYFPDIVKLETLVLLFQFQQKHLMSRENVVDSFDWFLSCIDGVLMNCWQCSGCVWCRLCRILCRRRQEGEWRHYSLTFSREAHVCHETGKTILIGTFTQWFSW